MEPREALLFSDRVLVPLSSHPAARSRPGRSSIASQTRTSRAGRHFASNPDQDLKTLRQTPPRPLMTQTGTSGTRHPLNAESGHSDGGLARSGGHGYSSESGSFVATMDSCMASLSAQSSLPGHRTAGACLAPRTADPLAMLPDQVTDAIEEFPAEPRPSTQSPPVPRPRRAGPRAGLLEVAERARVSRHHSVAFWSASSRSGRTLAILESDDRDRPRQLSRQSEVEGGEHNGLSDRATCPTRVRLSPQLGRRAALSWQRWP